jgi:Calcineurin-like phosphoesterase
MLRAVAIGLAAGLAVLAQQPAHSQQPAPAPPVPKFVAVRPIKPPDRPLPPESASANETKFSFIGYGDTRSSGTAAGQTPLPGDGDIVHPIHSQIADLMIERIKTSASSAYPVRFILQSGDAVLRGADGAQWNVSFSPIIERLTRTGGVPFFFSVGNHDVTGMPLGDPNRMMGLHNTLTAFSRLMPEEGSSRRLSGYPTYAFGYGNSFFVALDSNIANDELQLAWVTDQLEQIDRARYRHIVAFFHHPPFSSGPHGGDHVEPPTTAIRNLYMPLFRKHHVRLIVAGHDHLFDHWVERYEDGGRTYRMDCVVTGGGGAPPYAYSGEPDLAEYQLAGAAQKVRVEHLAKPKPVASDNPHHFLVVQVDGDRFSLEVVSLGPVLTPFNGRSTVDLNDH